jgi:Glycosyl hydrolase family 1
MINMRIAKTLIQGSSVLGNLINGRVNDSLRTSYIQSHILAIHQAIDKGVRIKGFYVWCNNPSPSTSPYPSAIRGVFCGSISEYFHFHNLNESFTLRTIQACE